VSRQKESHPLAGQREAKQNQPKWNRTLKKAIQLGNKIVLYTNFIQKEKEKEGNLLL